MSNANPNKIKFKNDFTKGGYKILSLHGPDSCEEYAGVVDDGEGTFLTITWYDTGTPVSANELYELIPLTDEPKSDPTADRLAELEKRVEALEQKISDTTDYHDLRLQIQDANVTIQRLRDDYLADQSAVQPSRVDAIEEKVTDANETAAFTNRKVGTLEEKFEELEKYAYTDHVELMNMALKRLEALENHLRNLGAGQSAVQPSRVDVLEERLDNLVAHHKHTESFAADILQRLNHVEDGLSKRIQDLEKDTDGTVTNLFDRLNEVEHDSKKTDGWAVRVNEDLHVMHNRILKLEQRSQPTDKGVWVTKKTLVDAYLKTSNINDLAKRLGLEE